MTIDEAIKRARGRANGKRKQAETYNMTKDRLGISKTRREKCIEIAETNEQLAEWLELLKWYQQGMEDIPSESGVLPKDVYRAGYIKAIDDFKRIICEELKLYIDHEDYMCVGLSLHKFTRDLAEQLKEGSADNE